MRCSWCVKRKICVRLESSASPGRTALVRACVVERDQKVIQNERHRLMVLQVAVHRGESKCEVKLGENSRQTAILYFLVARYSTMSRNSVRVS